MKDFLGRIKCFPPKRFITSLLHVNDDRSLRGVIYPDRHTLSLMSLKFALGLAFAVAIGAVLAAAPPQAAQQPAVPATEVFLASLTAGAKSIDTWINISNNPGYDNQPSFLPDSSGLLFSSNRDGKQMDIYRYDIAAKKVSQLTNTPEGEYSPTVTPDKKTFSVIRTEADMTQRLWRFDLDGSNPRLVLENLKPVGYHAWIDDTHLALFILGAGGGAPATLQLADTKTGLATVAATGIGRSVLIRPGKGTVSYLATGETPRVLKELDPKTGVSTTLTPPLEGSQDCAWMPDGRLLMARSKMIAVWMPGATTWSVDSFMILADEIGLARTGGVATVSSPGPNFANITRMAVSPDGKWLAFVAEPAAK
jgi:dipeptidyl aminopeptidase/acylaminoacyl peptidase